MLSAVDVAQAIGAALEDAGQDYALGGAMALGYWASPRGTLAVDVTLFVPPDQPSACLRLLQRVGCAVEAQAALASLQAHGFCRVSYRGLSVDIFLLIVPFYELARARRRRVPLGDRTILIWDAEMLAVFKLMFFRRKDVADLEQLLRAQGPDLDRAWIRCRVEELFGRRDPRLRQWDELVAEIGP